MPVSRKARKKEIYEMNHKILDGMKYVIGSEDPSYNIIENVEGMVYNSIESPRHRLDWLAKTMIVRHDGDGHQVESSLSLAEQASAKPTATSNKTPKQQGLASTQYNQIKTKHKKPLGR